MKILFVSKYYYPDVGGVQTETRQVQTVLAILTRQVQTVAAILRVIDGRMSP